MVVYANLLFSARFVQAGVQDKIAKIMTLVLAVVNVASAELINGINFLSAEYSASDSIYVSIITGGNESEGLIVELAQDSYSFPPQSNPINYHYFYSHTYEDSYGEDWDTFVDIGHHSGHLSVDTYAGVGAPGFSEACGYTTGIWDFQPQYSDMELRFDIIIDQGWNVPIGSILLQDLTTTDFNYLWFVPDG